MFAFVVAKASGVGLKDIVVIHAQQPGVGTQIATAIRGDRHLFVIVFFDTGDHTLAQVEGCGNVFPGEPLCFTLTRKD